MEQQIYELISDGKDVLLVGKKDSGKTFFIVNKLLPFLELKGKQVKYYKDLDENIVSVDDGIVVLDEVEILDDKEFLEDLHPDDSPFYTEPYLKKVEGWLDKINQINSSAIFVVTRNEDVEIDNLQKVTNLSIGKDTKVIKFI